MNLLMEIDKLYLLTIISNKPNHYTNNTNNNTQNNVLHITHEKDIEDFSLHGNLFTFNAKNYFIDIVNSYHNDLNNIKKQFSLDKHRTNIFINNTKINTFKDLYNKIPTKIGNLYICNFNGINLKFKYFIMLLFCQSSYAFPHSIIHYKYNDKNLCAISDVKDFEHSNNRYMKMKIKKNIVKFKIKNTYSIINFNTMTVEKKISCNLILHMNAKYLLEHYINNNKNDVCIDFNTFINDNGYVYIKNLI